MFWQHCEIVISYLLDLKHFGINVKYVLASENTKNEIGNSNDQLLIELKN